MSLASLEASSLVCLFNKAPKQDFERRINPNFSDLLRPYQLWAQPVLSRSGWSASPPGPDSPSPLASARGLSPLPLYAAGGSCRCS